MHPASNETRPRAALTPRWFALNLVLTISATTIAHATTPAACATTGSASLSSSPDQAKEQLSSFESKLADVSDTVKKLRRAAGDIYAEVNRHELVGNPDPLSDYMMDPWMSAYPGLYGIGPSGYELKKGPVLPPRKKWLDFHMKQLVDLTSILSSEIGGIASPKGGDQAARDSFSAQTKVMTDELSAIQTTAAQLTNLTAGPAFDNAGISKAAEALRDDLAGIETGRRRLFRMAKEHNMIFFE